MEDNNAKHLEKAREIVADWITSDAPVNAEWIGSLREAIAQALREAAANEGPGPNWPSEEECLKHRKIIAGIGMRDMISRGKARQMMSDYECWLRSKVEGK